MAEVRYRSAVPSDSASIKKVEIRCGLSAWPEASYREIAVSESKDMLAVAEAESDIVGFLFMRLITKPRKVKSLRAGKQDTEQTPEEETQHPFEAELCNIAVDSAWRRVGIASGLWGQICSQLSEYGAFCVFLEVRESNSGAIDFYSSLGFKEVGIRKNYYRDPAENAMLMTFHSDR